jgi:hypothetical protein
MTQGFVLTIHDLLDRGTDILGLCEVDRRNIQFIQELLDVGNYPEYQILDLYTSGNSIDDFCLIYNTTKLTVTAEPESANVRDNVTEKWLKAGVFVNLTLQNHGDIFVALSHWQSRQTYSETSVMRLKLGEAMRTKVSAIGDSHPNAPIILLGDYNDEPYHASIVSGLGASRDPAFVLKKPHYFYNPYWGCLAPREVGTPAGSYIHASAIDANGGAVYDQIMFSSHFVREWEFMQSGRVVGDIQISGSEMEWRDISDHYPILSHVRKQL